LIGKYYFKSVRKVKGERMQGSMGAREKAKSPLTPLYERGEKTLDSSLRWNDDLLRHWIPDQVRNDGPGANPSP